MQRPSYAFLLAIAAPISLAAPTDTLIQPQFTVNQRLNVQKSALLTPADFVLQPFHKFAAAGAKAPQKLLDGARQQSGSVVATPLANDGQYISPITVGGQTLNIDIDTGSSDLWVFSTLTPANQSEGHNVYDPDKSPSSALLKNQRWNITYGDGSASSGVVYADTVVVGGATATFQAVEAATSVAASFASNKANDGLLGLSFSSINTVKPTQQLTFFDSIKNSLMRKLFAVDLKSQQPGSYDFGFLNGQKYNDPITYTPIDSSTGFWIFNAGGYGVGTSKALKGNQGQAIPDTGTSLIYLPSAATLTYYAAVDGVQDIFGTYVFPCNTTLPDFHTSIGGRTFTVPGKYLSYAGIDQGLCLGGIQLNQGLPFSIYGDVFLKTVYAVFDQTQAKPRVGFATKDLD